MAMRKMTAGMWLAYAVGLSGIAGCETTRTVAQSKTVQGAAAGSALGAAAGAAIGHQTEQGGEGAAIGAGLGALGGGLVGHHLDGQGRPAQQHARPAAKRTTVCPVGGEFFPEDMKFCPQHGAELRHKEP